MADNLGWGDVGAYGHPTIRMQHLDRTAVEGQKWATFYSGAPYCTPSRAGLLTGRLPVRSGLALETRTVLFADSLGGLPQSEVTIPELLKGRGYATAMMGKWHLGAWGSGYRSQSSVECVVSSLLFLIAIPVPRQEQQRKTTPSWGPPDRRTSRGGVPYPCSSHASRTSIWQQHGSFLLPYAGWLCPPASAASVTHVQANRAANIRIRMPILRFVGRVTLFSGYWHRAQRSSLRTSLQSCRSPGRTAAARRSFPLLPRTDPFHL